MRVRVLHLEDDESDRELVARTLRAEGIDCAIVQADSRGDFERALDQPPDLILSDYSIPGFAGDEAQDLAQARCPGVPFVFVSGSTGKERRRRTAAEAELRQLNVQLEARVEERTRALVIANKELRQARHEADRWIVRSSFTPWTAHEVDVTVRRVGDLPTPVVPAYTAVDARYGWRLRPDLELSMLGQNLFDDSHPELNALPGRSEFERSVFGDLPQDDAKRVDIQEMRKAGQAARDRRPDLSARMR